MQASDVMTGHPLVIAPEATIEAAIDLMLGAHVSGLPVVDAEGKLVGVLSEGDLLRRAEIGTEKQKRPGWLDFLLGPGAGARDYVRAHASLVSELMTRDAISVGEATPLEEIVDLMEQNHIKRVPVVRGESVVGIVTRADLLRALRKKAAQSATATGTPPGDAAIGDAILAALKAQNWAPRGGLRFEVTEGIVTITGAIVDDRERDAIKVVAENVPGVKSVVDKMVWIDPSGSGAYYGPPDEV